ncbi:hypothetical protein D3C81_957140 [compost metagenome]
MGLPTRHDNPSMVFNCILQLSNHRYRGRIYVFIIQVIVFDNLIHSPCDPRTLFDPNNSIIELRLVRFQLPNIINGYIIRYNKTIAGGSITGTNFL